MMGSSKMDWGAHFNIDLESNYNIPKGMQIRSYTTFESILEELRMSHSNKKRTLNLGQELARNNNNDFWMRVGLCASSILISGALLLTKLRKIRELVRRSNKTDPLSASGVNLPMCQARLA